MSLLYMVDQQVKNSSKVQSVYVGNTLDECLDFISRSSPGLEVISEYIRGYIITTYGSVFFISSYDDFS